MSPLRFMLVQGEAEVAEDLSARLSLLGHQVAGVACSGPEALERFPELRPDVLVVDTDLPDGVDTALALRRIREIPILLLKEEGREELSTRESLAAPAGLLLKPLCDRELRAVLRMALDPQRTLFREVVENSAAMIYVKDREGRYLLVNRRWEEITRQPREQALGRNDAELFPWADHAGWHQADRQALEGNEAVQLEETVQSPLGELHFLSVRFPHRDQAGRVLGVCGMSTEITGLKQAELDLRKALEKARLFRSILDEAPAYIYIKDRSHRYVYANRMTLELFGCSLEEVIGRGDGDFFSPETAEQLRRVDQRVLAGEQVAGEVPAVLPSGEARLYWEIKTPLEGEPIWGLVGISTDITERQQAEEERARLQEQLQQALKMESIGRLAGGVAHDYNNMLTVILGQAELALEGMDPHHPLFPELQEIRSAAERSANLTRQLLAFARKQATHPRVLDLNQTVTSMLGLLRRLLGEHLQLEWKPDPELWPVRMDPAQVDQILANLCVNARDALGTGGKVTLQTSNVRSGEAGAPRDLESLPGDSVMLVVRDNGCGMDARTRSRLFEPFFTTKGFLEGTGLGLATVYGVVRQNGGTIRVESEPGQGSTFRIYLPRLDSSPSPERPALVHRATPRGRGTILLVEDEPALLKLTRSMLEHLGYTVLEASRPSEAMRLAQEHGEAIDLLLTDIMMPEMSGLQLAETLSGPWPELRCLFTSGFTADVVAGQARPDRDFHFLPKPFSLQELGIRVQETLAWQSA